VLEKVLKSILSGILGYIRMWYEAEKAKAAEWNAEARKAQMESMKRTPGYEARIKTTPVPTAETPGDWNAGASDAAGGHSLTIVALLFTVMLLNSGCIVRTVYVESKWPYLVRPGRPLLSAEPVEWTSREVLLKDYALTMEARIDEYNKLAREKNIASGYETPDNAGEGVSHDESGSD